MRFFVCTQSVRDSECEARPFFGGADQNSSNRCKFHRDPPYRIVPTHAHPHFFSKCFGTIQNTIEHGEISVSELPAHCRTAWTTGLTHVRNDVAANGKWDGTSPSTGEATTYAKLKKTYNFLVVESARLAPTPTPANPPAPPPARTPSPPPARTPSPPPPATGPPTFAASEFKRAYEATAAPKFQHEVFSSLQKLLEAYCATNGIADSERDGFFSELQREAFNHPGELLGEVEAVAQRLWTSARKLPSEDRELCSIMNAAVRSQDPALCGPVAVLARAINRLVVTRRADSALPFPPGGITVRGGGLPDEHRDFFTPGKRFRSPGFLATSFSEDKAYGFWYRAHVESGLPAVKWVVYVDPRGETSQRYRCKHVNLVTKTNVPGEQEYLFAPYSVFTVRSVQFSESANDDEPHLIELDAAIDNRKESEDLPTAPWA